MLRRFLLPFLLLSALAGCAVSNDRGLDMRLTAQQQDKAAILIGMRTTTPSKATFKVTFYKVDPITHELGRNIFGTPIPDETFDIGHNSLTNNDSNTATTKFYARLVEPGAYLIASVYTHDAYLMATYPILTCVARPMVYEVKAGHVNYIGNVIVGINDNYMVNYLNQIMRPDDAKAAMTEFPGLTAPFQSVAGVPSKNVSCGQKATKAN